MLACGEDLGMIPDSVPETMRALQILSLEIQRMPKSLGEVFADPTRYPYFSVCTTSTHDMNPLRAWWEENRELGTFLPRSAGHGGQRSPHLRTVDLPPHRRHAPPLPGNARHTSAAGLARDRRGPALPDPAKERINIPAAPRYYWRYRMHLTLEELRHKETFNESLHDMIACSGRR